MNPIIPVVGSSNLGNNFGSDIDALNNVVEGLTKLGYTAKPVLLDTERQLEAAIKKYDAAFVRLVTWESNPLLMEFTNSLPYAWIGFGTVIEFETVRQAFYNNAADIVKSGTVNLNKLEINKGIERITDNLGIPKDYFLNFNRYCSHCIDTNGYKHIGIPVASIISTEEDMSRLRHRFEAPHPKGMGIHAIALA